MRMLEVHTVPLWEEEDGSRTLGIHPRDPYPEVVGWCNAVLVRIEGEDRWFVLNGGVA